ncbi:hypothetical protein WFZ85_08390 [Flavobacterium sp. j3]|uniref:Cyclic nucleotide-binding domain-containing protein n=1 Tax=Flavobacterium aureirubrum TaxID=3133147 RepID=A0ABU9N4U5_9FLAO
MKKSLFLYLFIIAVLMNIFTYKYFTTKTESELNTMSKSVKKVNDSIAMLKTKLDDSDYFSLENNDRAQNYLSQNNLPAFEDKVKQSLLAFNDDAAGNKYVDQPKMGEQKFIINRIKILNHRWIIADYSNGSLWGEVLIKYFVNEDGTISFETIDSYLYTLDLN